jgi:hypothetical protein
LRQSHARQSRQMRMVRRQAHGEQTRSGPPDGGGALTSKGPQPTALKTARPHGAPRRGQPNIAGPKANQRHRGTPPPRQRASRTAVVGAVDPLAPRRRHVCTQGPTLDWRPGIAPVLHGSPLHAASKHEHAQGKAKRGPITPQPGLRAGLAIAVGMSSFLPGRCRSAHSGALPLPHREDPTRRFEAVRFATIRQLATIARPASPVDASRQSRSVRRGTHAADTETSEIIGASQSSLTSAAADHGPEANTRGKQSAINSPHAPAGARNPDIWWRYQARDRRPRFA